MPPSRLVVDGASYDVSIGPDRSLLHVLREELGVTAPKYGCGEGECGACTVLLDGQPVAACVTPIGAALGRVLTTASGLGGTALLHPIQRALADVGAMECGYCTPGMATAAAALLARIPDPDDTAIRVALQGHICRCGAYQRIIQAVHRAAELARRPAEPPPAAPLGTALAQLRRPAVPWDLDEDRDYFAILPDGLVAVLAPESVPPEAWSVSGGAWIHVGVDGEVTAFTGKVDFGQGNRAGLTRLVADELGISPTRVDLVMGDTDLCPFDEGTFGSLSTPEAGAVLRATAAAVREFLRGELPEPGSRHCIMVEDAVLDPQPTSSAEPSPRHDRQSPRRRHRSKTIHLRHRPAGNAARCGPAPTGGRGDPALGRHCGGCGNAGSGRSEQRQRFAEQSPPIPSPLAGLSRPSGLSGTRHPNHPRRVWQTTSGLTRPNRRDGVVPSAMRPARSIGPWLRPRSGFAPPIRRRTSPTSPWSPGPRWQSGNESA